MVKRKDDDIHESSDENCPDVITGEDIKEDLEEIINLEENRDDILDFAEGDILEYLEIDGENILESQHEKEVQIHENGESTLEWNGDDSLEFGNF